MRRLTTPALLAGMFSAPALHSEELATDASAPLSFPQLNGAAGNEPGDKPPAAAPEEATPVITLVPAGDAALTTPVPEISAVTPPVSNTVAPDVIPITSTQGGDLSLAQMGTPDGIILSGGQRQGGVSFALPSDQVVIHSQLSLAVRVSPEMASRNAALQLALSGQSFGTSPLGADGKDVFHYQLDIPPALMVSNNSLNVKINDGDTLRCQRDIHDSPRVTVLPTSHFSWGSRQLNTSDDLSHFPRSFFDNMQMTPADIVVAYGAKPSTGAFSAAALVSPWLGIQADYRGITLGALRDRLLERHGAVINHPGRQVGGMTLLETNKLLLRVTVNPADPVYKLLLIIGKNDMTLYMAVWWLTRGNFAPQTATLGVEPQIIPVDKAYSVPRWIPTDHPVRLNELSRKDQSPTVSSVWHEPLHIAFCAAPDPYLWDGETVPLQVGYRFPPESWINEDKSLPSVILNGTFPNNLTMNKQGPLEKVQHHLRGGARQERFTTPPTPYLIYGDNQLSMYFNMVPRDGVPCSVLLNNNTKSWTTDDSWVDLSKTRRFSLLPNLPYFVGTSLPFS